MKPVVNIAERRPVRNDFNGEHRQKKSAEPDAFTAQAQF
jgi:hypothetical protein